MAEGSVKHVVVDSGGFIRNAPLRGIGEHIYSLVDVVHEIRDRATRDRLQVLPYEIKFREPPTEAIRAVTDFSKKTGDYRSLSAVDIRVMALVYQLEKENVGTDHIKTQPQRNVSWITTTKHLEKPTDIAGFYLGKKHSATKSRSTSETDNSSVSMEQLSNKLQQSNMDVTSEPEQDPGIRTEDVVTDDSLSKTENTDTHEPLQVNITVVDSESHNPTEGTTNTREDGQLPVSAVENESHTHSSTEEGTHKTEDNTSNTEPTGLAEEGQTIPAECVEEDTDDEDESSEEEEDDDDDDDGWITPSNISAVKASMGEKNVETAQVDVACLTTDFAMQNVLIQMGLNVVSVDGLLIKRAKSYVLRCSACMKVTTNMTKEFCPNCGNKTLQKLSMTVDDDGKIQYFLSRRKPMSTRGLRYSLPMPKGGKHATNPIMCADQREAQQRLSRAGRVKTDVLDQDYVSHTSPFAAIDVTSRAALLGIKSQRHGFNKRRNPNENNKVYGRRK